MAGVIIRSFTISPSTVAPGQTTDGYVDPYDPDNRTTRVRASVGSASAVTVLTVADEPIPDPVFEEVDADGNVVPEANRTLDFAVDPGDSTHVFITARELP